MCLPRKSRANVLRLVSDTMTHEKCTKHAHAQASLSLIHWKSPVQCDCDLFESRDLRLFSELFGKVKLKKIIECVQSFKSDHVNVHRLQMQVPCDPRCTLHSCSWSRNKTAKETHKVYQPVSVPTTQWYCVPPGMFPDRSRVQLCQSGSQHTANQ